MEKHRASVVLNRERFLWHARKTLSTGLSQTQFHKPYVEPKILEQHRREETENTIYDIHMSTSRETIQKLEIKHRTGEK